MSSLVAGLSSCLFANTLPLLKGITMYNPHQHLDVSQVFGLLCSLVLHLYSQPVFSQFACYSSDSVKITTVSLQVRGVRLSRSSRVGESTSVITKFVCY